MCRILSKYDTKIEESTSSEWGKLKRLQNVKIVDIQDVRRRFNIKSDED